MVVASAVVVVRGGQGPLSQVLSMIPGLPNGMMPQGQEKAGAQRLKNFCTMMDSMTDTELDSQKTLDPGLGNPKPTDAQMKDRHRVMRISAGSGRYPQEGVQLLDEHKRFSNMVGKMGKLGKGKGANWEQDMMKRNPKMMMQQLQSCMDPRMMQQLGGADNLMTMMKEMNGMDLSQFGLAPGGKKK